MKDLALHGGKKVRKKDFPTVNDSSGRFIGKEEKRLIGEVLKSGKLNRVYGDKVKEFERMFSSKLNIEYAVASTSGTAALHIALAAINPEPGDEIITPPVTDMGTIIAIIHRGALPVFADVDPIHGIIETESVLKKINNRTKAVIVVHLFGLPSNTEYLKSISKEHGFYIIEDCAQAHFAEYNGKYVGTLGDIGCFSFQQSKQITTGDGGMTVTNNKYLAERAKLFSDKCYIREGSKSNIPFLGMNYRMTELQAAIGIEQLKKLNRILNNRRISADTLTKRLKTIDGVYPVEFSSNLKHSYWRYSFQIDNEIVKCNASQFVIALNAEGIPCTLGYNLSQLRDQNMIPRLLFEHDCIQQGNTFGDSAWPFSINDIRKIDYNRDDYPNALYFQSNIINISWNERIKDNDVEDIACAIQKIVSYYMD